MLIAVTSEGPSLDARINGRFGRCQYFLIINTDDLSFEAVENQNAALGGGAGIQSAQMIAAKGVTHVFTGACGPNAYQVLTAAGIEVVTGCGGGVRDVINQFRKGSFSAAGGPNVADHYGTGQTYPGQAGPGMSAGVGSPPGIGRGMGRGGGMGRGMGMGRGTGMGRGGMGDGFAGRQTAGVRDMQEAGGDELETLKRQMEQISERIRELEKKKAAK
ncbi:MAG TPA: dinitrogenase iron-molybdenum cofactor biosynthesis protein [Deltaproteobacteria bacterium]|nr:dinitrogenase iron-molybdenum cofactor biosynthesis protein [Deltaproteobacteria bacterium]